MLPEVTRRTAVKALGLVGTATVLSSDAGPEAVGTASAVERRGPLPSNRFSVELTLEGTEVTGWKRIELPTASVTKAEWRDGDDPAQHQHLWGGVQFEPLFMERGVEPEGEAPITGDTLVGTLLFDWYQAVKLGAVPEARKQIGVTILNERGEALVKYVFYDAWPIQYHPPTLDASARGEVALEGLTIAYHRYERAE